MIEFIITKDPDQQFSAVVNRQRITLRFRFNNYAARWHFDLAIDDQWVIQGRRIVLGVDLLAAFNLDLGMIFAWPEKDGAEPGLDELTDGRVKLYQANAEEVIM